MTPFSCQVTRVGGTAVVTAVGEVDLSTHGELVDAGAGAMADGVHVVLDCAEISFLDSRGLTALLELQRRADDAGATFALAAVPPSVARVLELSGTEALFAVVERPGVI